MTSNKYIIFQYLMDTGEFGWSPLCGNADHPVFPGVGMCRPGSGAVATGQGASAPVTGLGVF
jgi:hypothetical protein